MSENNTHIRNEMLKKLNIFADELRKRGFYVEVGHKNDEMFERYFIDIVLDKTREKTEDFYT